MKDNQLKNVWYVMLLTITFVFIIFFVPEFSVFGYQFKKLNLVAEIQREVQVLPAKDSIIIKKDSVTVVVAPVTNPGRAFIEDFGKDNLRYFFEELHHSKTKPVRIAFFGDSFIEGDILCGPFRDTLQRMFGGSGVGYMPITSEVNKFRTSIQHDFSQWRTYSMVGKKNDNAPLGLPGYCFLPDEGNEVLYKPAVKDFVSAKIFYESDKYSALSFEVNKLTNESVDLKHSGRLSQYNLPGSGFNSIKLSFSQFFLEK